MSKPVGTNLDFKGTSRILNLPAPVDPNEPARLAEILSAVEGLAWKDSCRVATQANVSLAAPGAQIDGVNLAAGDRVLLRAQTAAKENGIYVWNGAATSLTRALDANTANELEQAITSVEEGTSAGSSFRQSAVNFTLETDSVNWTTFGQNAAPATEQTAGVAQIATQSEVDAGTVNNKIVTPLTLKNYSGRKLKAAGNIGDGSATAFTLTHNFGTRDVAVGVYLNSGDYDEVFADIKRPTDNSVQIIFAAAPPLNGYRVVILG